MKLPQIVRYLTETDLYKMSMGQAIHHQFPGHMTTWAFACRNPGVRFTHEMVEEIKEQIQAYCELSYTPAELRFLSTIPWLKPDYIAFLRDWHPHYDEFYIAEEGPHNLEILTKGPWVNTSPYEMPILMIVNEVWFRMQYDYALLWTDFKERLQAKYDALRSGRWHVGNFSGFGLRRRLSGEAEELFTEKFSHLNDTRHCSSTFVGTSNVYMAWQHGLKVTGTMAHEWIMGAGQGDMRNNPAYCNWHALNAWIKEYGVLNGIALTDTIGLGAFLQDFQYTFSKTFDGVRHDSGDPIAWGEAMIEHYKSFDIDPMTKTLLFSDSLNFEKADRIFRYFNGRAHTAFGIGTYLTNDTFAEPLNIVMKMIECNGHPVAKLSDSAGKCMCKDEKYIDFLKQCIVMRGAELPRSLLAA